jgi:RHS repeat-associated protein
MYDKYRVTCTFRTTTSVIPCLLALMVALLAPAFAFAAGTWQWTAQLNGNGMPVLGPFATKEQAQQALANAAVQRCVTVGYPCPQEATTLQDQGIVAMTPNSKTFFYNAIVASTPTAYSCYWWTDDPAPPNQQLLTGSSSCYSSVANAVAAETFMPGCTPTSTNSGVTSAGSWGGLLGQYNPNPGPPIIEGSNEPYSTWYQDYYVNNCATTQGSTELLLWRSRTASCPENFSPLSLVPGDPPQPVPGTDSLCQGVIGGTVSANFILDCPSNDGPVVLMGDPCNVETGDLTETETDYAVGQLRFVRTYHSLTPEMRIGVGWTYNYGAYLILTGGVPAGLLRPDGHEDALVAAGSGVYISLSGAGIHVQEVNSQWVAYLKDGAEEVYNTSGKLLQITSPSGLVTTLSYSNAGRLLSVSDAFGHGLQFGYNNINQITSVIEPDGSRITYGYDANNNLTTATYPDSSVRTYQYTNSTFPNSLTGILDEQNQQYLTVVYDSTGAVSSSYQGGTSIEAQNLSLTYSANGAVGTDVLGATHTFTFTNNSGYSPRASSVVVNGQTQSFVVPSPTTDVQQRVTKYTDANNNITTYSYDSNHMTAKTEGYGSSVARTTSYPTYQDTLTSLPTLVTEPLRNTAYAYNAGTYELHTKTITDTTVTPNVSRTWTYTYTSAGQVQTIDGPRTDVSDVTTYSYYTCTTGTQCGEVDTIKDALGHVTTFDTYNGHGQPLTITDPNGVVTTLTYDKRQRLLSSKVGTETTSYSYWPTGLLKEVTLPDSSTVTYIYDAAHRLTTITDGLGNYVSYTLDAMGNRTAEKSYDPTKALHRSHTRVYNALNELYQEINSAGTAAVTTTLGYDSNHNLTSSDAPLSRNTGNEYDALNRVNQTTDPNSGVSKFGYDANNKLVSILDPRSLTTSYTNDGFGEVTTLVSPDTGTATKTYDSAGNLKTTTDARGALATYTYDALNRMTQVAYADQTIKYSYDTGTDGIGQLTGASDANHSMSWSYNAQGRVTGKGQTVGSVTKSVGYGYTNDDLTSIVTPSGQTIAYGYTNHRITSITVNGAALLSGVTYDPFGPATGWTWGNGSTVSRTYTEDGNPNEIVTAGVTNTYTVDDASRITGISDSGLSSNTFTFGYDLLDRVKTGTSSAISRGYTYDANNNRSTETGTVAFSATISSTDNQIVSTSGGLARAYSYDSAGNTKSYTGATFTFNDRGRMSSAVVSGGTTNYIYNALGQLIEKSGYEGTTLLVYDEADHLLGEYSSTGALIQETVWMDDLPVATLRPNGSNITVYYVHADHLGTPRKITNPSGNTVVWRWDPDTYGTASPSIATITYNLRFPGQYYLPETELYYNYFRTLDPQTGRYLESDPMGLAGGNYSTYAYVEGNPISRSDLKGLFSLQISDSWKMVGTIPEHPGALGFTNWAVNASCQCTCGPSSELVGCNAHVYINVQIQTGFSASKEAFVKHGEYQHVLDLADASGTYRSAGEAIEQDIKGRSFSSEEECETRSRNAVISVLIGVVESVYEKSIDRWDTSGLHTYWPWSSIN